MAPAAEYDRSLSSTDESHPKMTQTLPKKKAATRFM